MNEGKFILEIKCFSDNRNRFEVTHTLYESKKPIVCNSPQDLESLLSGMAHSLPRLLSTGHTEIYEYNLRRYSISKQGA